jgi:hypothetical protein
VLAAKLREALSHLDHLPLLGKWTPPYNQPPSQSSISELKKAQQLAEECVAATIKAMQPDWSERSTAAFIRQWLGERGVSDYFHRPLVWFGERTLLSGMATLEELRPSTNVLGTKNSYILDFGPIVDGVATDFSYSGCVGNDPEHVAALNLLRDIWQAIPGLFMQKPFAPKAIWQNVTDRIVAAGYLPVHGNSRFAFFGHRVNGTRDFPLARYLAQRNQQTFYEFFARGVFGALWTKDYAGDPTGVWAIEPHFGTDKFAVKFEEILVVTPERCDWLRNF